MEDCQNKRRGRVKNLEMWKTQQEVSNNGILLCQLSEVTTSKSKASKDPIQSESYKKLIDASE